MSKGPGIGGVKVFQLDCKALSKRRRKICFELREIEVERQMIWILMITNKDTNVER